MLSPSKMDMLAIFSYLKERQKELQKKVLRNSKKSKMKFSAVFSICVGAVASFSGVSAKPANPFLLSDDLVSQARDSLNETYGTDAVKVFDAFLDTTNSNGGGAKELIHTLEDAATHVAQDAMSKSSFLAQQMQSMAKGSYTTEMAANKCNYGRMLATGAYQSQNMLTHIVSTLVSLGCGCFYTTPISTCVLSEFYLCESFDNVRAKLLSQSGQLWKSVQNSTKACTMHGDVSVVGA